MDGVNSKEVRSCNVFVKIDFFFHFLHISPIPCRLF
jgi:hypothetical protein